MGRAPGSSLIEVGSLIPGALREQAVSRAASERGMSNWLLVSAKRSATHHALGVLGPQLGYFYPELVMQMDLHGGGIDAEGIVAPIAPWVFIGRGKDFAWSLTTAHNDNTDEFLERLCNPDGSAPTNASDHYRYKGQCRAMGFFDAGTLKASGDQPDKEITFHYTVHGPVIGTVTVNGAPYAV